MRVENDFLKFTISRESNISTFVTHVFLQFLEKVKVENEFCRVFISLENSNSLTGYITSIDLSSSNT